MGEIIQTKKRRRCDFCGRDSHEAEYLIVSPAGNADICEVCVATCSEIIAEKRDAKAQSTATTT